MYHFPRFMKRLSIKPKAYLSTVLISLVLFGANPVLATSINFSGSGTGNDNAALSASALFDITDDILTITLTNTATSDNTLNSNKDVPGNTLAGVKWDWNDGLLLTPLAALIPAGSIVQGNECNFGLCNGATTNVGGEFAYNTDIGGFEYALSSSGWIGLPAGNFNGPNLDDPDAPNGINFGIISNDPSFLPNGGLSSEPLIRNSVVLTFSGASGLSLSDISNVTFQYGTSLTEPMFPSNHQEVVPEPSTIVLFASGLIGLAAWRYRKSKNSTGEF